MCLAKGQLHMSAMTPAENRPLNWLGAVMLAIDERIMISEGDEQQSSHTRTHSPFPSWHSESSSTRHRSGPPA